MSGTVSRSQRLLQSTCLRFSSCGYKYPVVPSTCCTLLHYAWLLRTVTAEGNHTLDAFPMTVPHTLNKDWEHTTCLLSKHNNLKVHNIITELLNWGTTENHYHFYSGGAMLFSWPFPNRRDFLCPNKACKCCLCRWPALKWHSNQRIWSVNNII